MKKNITLWITFCLIFSAVFPAPLLARGVSPLDIENEISDFYDSSKPTAPGARASNLTQADLDEYALEIFDHIASIQNIESYNDLLEHMVADYRHHPEHRIYLEKILSFYTFDDPKDDPSANEMRNKLREEIAQAHDQTALGTVLDDITLAFGIALAFEFGKGLWTTRGSGLQGFEKFTHVVESVTARTKMVTSAGKMRRGVILVGGAAGIADAVYQHFRTQRLDPSHILSGVQYDILLSLEKQAASLRKEAIEMNKESLPQLKLHGDGYQGRLTSMLAELQDVNRQAKQLKASCAQYTARIEDLSKDMKVAADQLDSLDSKLRSFELMGNDAN